MLEAGHFEVQGVTTGQTLAVGGDSRCHSSECKQLSISELLHPVGYSAGPHTVAAWG